MDLSPSVLTMTQKLRTSTWKQDYGMAEILPMNQKKPVKWFNLVHKKYKKKALMTKKLFFIYK